jgi:hypothetical protein
VDRHDELLAEIRGELETAERARDVERARAFLRALDPESSEGMWFDAMVDRYPTRLDAAIAYVREVKVR